MYLNSSSDFSTRTVPINILFEYSRLSNSSCDVCTNDERNLPFTCIFVIVN